MIKKSIFRILLAFLFLITFSQTVFSYTLRTADGMGPYDAGSGGEFTLKPGDGLEWVLNYYDAKAKNAGGTSNTFQSFCLEYNENISDGTLYSATLSNASIYGGTYHASDPLSKGTAWLYSLFAKGTLSGYHYGSGRTTSAAEFQEAIWWLEDEISLSDPDENSFIHAAITQFGGTAAGAKANADGLYGVKVVNLWKYGYAGNIEYRRQDTLVVTPIPSAVWLLGCGLIGLVGIRRRNQA